MKHISKILLLILQFWILQVYAQKNPNLEIKGFTLDLPEVEAGEILPFSYKLINSGSGISGATQTGICFSSSPANMDFYGQSISESGSMGTGETKEVSGSFTVPADTPPGIYYVRLKADIYDLFPELSENDNLSQVIPFLVKRRSIEIDLSLTHVSVSPVSFDLDKEVEFAASIMNRGDDHVNNVPFEIHISHDQILSTEDTELFSVLSGTLSPGSGQELSGKFLAPSQWDSELAYLIFTLDKNGHVPETDGHNNQKIIPVQIEIKSFDFLLSEVALNGLTTGKKGVITIEQDTLITIDYVFQNIGERPLKAAELSVVNFYLSGNENYDNGFETYQDEDGTDIYLGGISQTKDFRAGSHYFLLRSEAKPGNYTFFAVANNYNIVTNTREKNYDNNVISMPVKVVANSKKPELVANSLTFDSNIVSAGNFINYSASVLNVGNRAALYFDIDIALDTDKDPDNGYYLRLKRFTDVEVKVSEVYRISDSLFINENVPAGIYYVHLVADPANKLSETLTVNNIVTSHPLQIKAVDRDLVLQELILNKTRFEAGDEISFKVLARNDGTLSAHNITLQVAISEDGSFDPGKDIQLGSREIDLDSGESSLQEFDLTIPDLGLTGDHYLFVSVDRSSSGMYNEIAGSSNLLARKISIMDPNPGEYEYCESSGDAMSGGYITRVRLNTLDNSSPSPASEAYEDFTHLTTELVKGDPYILTINSENSGLPEWYAAWIDFNRDGDFDDPDEQLFTQGPTSSGLLEFTVTIPSGASEGLARLRISMGSGRQEGPPSCGATGAGEVEDYSVVVLGPSVSASEATPSEGTSNDDTAGDDGEAGPADAENMGTVTAEEKISGADEVESLKIYPNPVSNTLHAESQKEVQVCLADLTGKQLIPVHTQAAGTSLDLDLSRLSDGTYLLVIQEGQKTTIRKIIKDTH